jgi:hypothetical protein
MGLLSRDKSDYRITSDLARPHRAPSLFLSFSFSSPLPSPARLRLTMVKAVVLGAAGLYSSSYNAVLKLTQYEGGIGQPLALLLKTNPLVTEVIDFSNNLAPQTQTH